MTSRAHERIALFFFAGSAIYKLACDVNFVEIGKGGSSNGAGRVCANLERGAPTDVGTMSREWKSSEAAVDKKQDFLYHCLQGDQDRSAIQIDVARDGVAVAVHRNGPARKCINILGGLTMDQLRWMFTSYSDSELEETGWDPSCLQNSDGNSATHLWSELDSRCDEIEIRIAGRDSTSGTFEIVAEAVFVDHSNGETFGTNRPFGYFETDAQELLVGFLDQYQEAISYMGFSYYYEFGSTLEAVPIEHEEPGNFVLPSFSAIGDGSYHKLSRTIYMNVLNDVYSLVHTTPFVKFGLERGDLVAVTGNVPIVNVDEMRTRLENAPYKKNGEDSSSESGLSDAALVGIVVGAGLTILYGAMAAYAYYCCLRNRWEVGEHDHVKDRPEQSAV